MNDFGILALVPPLLSIGLAILTKDVFVSLSIGCFFGAMMVSNWNPFMALFNLIVNYLFPQMADSYNAQAFFMMVLVGSSAVLLTASGGALAFKNNRCLNVFTKNRRMAEVGTWLGGLFVWFSDNANCFIVGPTFDTINNNARVSKEKFSYILDCTTSPICALIPIMGWGVYIMSLIDKEIAGKAFSMSAWDMFCQAIPYSTYAILTLIMCGFMAWSQWDFGPMLKAQMRAEKLNKLNADDAVPMRLSRNIELPEGVKPRLGTLLWPLLVILVCIFAWLFIQGFPYKPVPGSKIRASIAYGFICGDILLFILMPYYKIMPFKKCMKTLTDGMSGMVYICVVLLLAWSLGAICKDIGTATYIVNVAQGVLSPRALPALIFIFSCLVSFATGTSWGTYALFTPIAIPLAIQMNSPLPICLAAMISGGLFGDHCSPISDSTIMASMGSGGDLIAHFETQMPYAVLVGATCTVLYLFSGTVNPFLLLLIGLAIVVSITFVLHKYYMRKYAAEFQD